MTDYVIVGGGIYGCTVAWELAKRGEEALLLEAKAIASGASGGLGERGVRANGRDLRELPLMRLAYDIWPVLHEHIGGFTGYRRLGHLHLIEREVDLAGAPAQVWMQNQQGIESRLLDVAQLRELEPQVSENVIAAIYCPKDGVADHTATTRAMANAARVQGARIVENARVTGMQRQADRVVSLSVTIDGEASRDRGQQASRPLVECACRRLRARRARNFAAHLADVAAGDGARSAHSATHDAPHRPRPSHAGDQAACQTAGVMVSGGWRGRWDKATGQGAPIAEQVEGNRPRGGRGLSRAGGCCRCTR